MALTGDKNSVTTFQEIENRLFRRKKKVYTKPEMTEEYLTVNPYSRPGREASHCQKCICALYGKCRDFRHAEQKLF